MNFSDDPAVGAVLRGLDFLQYKVSTVVCVLGIVGNILAILVCASNRRLRRSTCGVYLMALAAYDTIYLICQFVVNLYANGLLVFFSTGACGLLLFLVHASSCLSPLVVVCFTAERFVVVRFPLHRARICTLEKTRKVLLFMLPYPVVIFGILATTEELDETGGCSMKRDNTSMLINAVVQFIDIFVSCLIPVFVILVLNGLIARDLIRASRQQQILTGSNRSEARIKNLQEEEARRNEKAITSMLVTVAMTFAVLNLPSYIVRIKVQYVLVVARDLSLWTATDEIAEKIATVLYIINFAIDFLLYNASSKNFRSATAEVMRKACWWKGGRYGSGWPSTTSANSRISTVHTEMSTIGSVTRKRPSEVTANGETADDIMI